MVLAVSAFLPIATFLLPPETIEAPASSPNLTLSVPAVAVIISAPSAKVTLASKVPPSAFETVSEIVAMS